MTCLQSGEGGGEVVVGSVDGTVRTYDLRMGKKVEDVIAGWSSVSILTFVGDGQADMNKATPL